MMQSIKKRRTHRKKHSDFLSQDSWLNPERSRFFRVFSRTVKTTVMLYRLMPCPFHRFYQSSMPDDQALELYAKRAIETLFAGLKSRGSNLEQTHMTKTQRLSTLLNLLALAFVWAHLVGEWLTTEQAIALKKHGRKAKSTFRLGLDFMRKAVLNLQHQQVQDDLRDAINIFSCT
jgi:hypothetical protein